MSSKTKIVVLRMKEIIYTGIFLGLAVVLIALCLIMFRHGEPEAADQAAVYTPGVYSASLNLGNHNVNVEVTVDADRINSIALVPLDQAVTTMYPLMQPSLEELADQIIQTQSLENITYSVQSHYTSTALLKAIDRALEKARI